MNTPEKKEWESRLDVFFDEYYGGYPYQKELADFISSELSTQRREILEGLLKDLPVFTSEGNFYSLTSPDPQHPNKFSMEAAKNISEGYNRCLGQVINLIKGKMK